MATKIISSRPLPRDRERTRIGEMSNLETILATIESSQLVSPDVLDELRRRLEQSPQAADLRSAVRWLVQKEHMTSDQGRRLLAGKQPSPAPSADDEMKLAPMDDEPAKAAARPAPSPPAAARCCACRRSRSRNRSSRGGRRKKRLRPRRRSASAR